MSCQVAGIVVAVGWDKKEGMEDLTLEIVRYGHMLSGNKGGGNTEGYKEFVQG